MDTSTSRPMSEEEAQAWKAKLLAKLKRLEEQELADELDYREVAQDRRRSARARQQRGLVRGVKQCRHHRAQGPRR